MAGNKTKYHYVRVLLAFLVVFAGLLTWAFWPGQTHVPKLGLDLQGGTQVTLVPKTSAGAPPLTAEQLSQTVSIIRQRVNGLGVAEADVTTQGSGSSSAIVVSVPGSSSQAIADQLKQTALLDFRPVENVTTGAPTTPAEPPKKGTPAPKPIVPPVQDTTNSQALQQAFAQMDCTAPDAHKGGVPDNPDKWLVTCSQDGAAKYLLAPAFIRGTNVTNASPTLAQNSTGWQVDLTFDGDGAKKLATVSSDLSKKPSPQNQFGIVLDGLVQSSPYFSEPILGGNAQISGQFSATQAKELAQVLKYGALPVSLDVGEITTVSPTLGADQLKAGLIAGALGLLLVAVYLLFMYRLLGVVAITSLVVASVILFAGFVILGRTVGLALTLAGVSGAIVAIGITADSFIVYFERIKDELRDGKPVRVAVDAGWIRARRTLLAADFVSLLAAAILYYLSIGSVRGFAFVLGVTTIIDVAVAFWFTHPLTVWMFNRSWFSKGQAFTGLNVDKLAAQGAAEREADPARTPRSSRQTRRKRVPA